MVTDGFWQWDLMKIGTPSVPKPDALPADADDIDKAGFQEDIKLWAKDKLVSLFDVIWGSVVL